MGELKCGGHGCTWCVHGGRYGQPHPMRFYGEMVEKFLELDYEMYSPIVVEEKGIHILYVELLKALYGTPKVAWLFWGKVVVKIDQ